MNADLWLVLLASFAGGLISGGICDLIRARRRRKKDR